ncbi:MAG: hypothetical protein ACF8NJ_02735 [Phycisphaerales bacterium JB038]
MNTSEPRTACSESRPGLNTPAAILWASAFLLAGMLITQLGRTTGNPAYAEMVSETSSGLSLMTTQSNNSSQDYVTVLDSPAQQLYVYTPTVRDGFELIARVELNEAFSAGRKASD